MTTRGCRILRNGRPGAVTASVVVAAVDCGTLTAILLDIALPSSGTLLIFYFDGQINNYQPSSTGTRTSRQAPALCRWARAEHAPPRAFPDGIEPYEQVDLTAEPVVTFPALEHPDLRVAFKAPGEDLRAFLGHPVNDAAFAEALAGCTAGPRHQAGG